MNKKRFFALDQVRGLAICAMVFAHFGPGFYERLGLSGLLLDTLNFLGRTATPAFVLIFGFTLAIAYLPKAAASPDTIKSALLKRSVLVFYCALLVALPKTIVVLYDAYTSGVSDLFFQLIKEQYSVLAFYTVGIAISAYAVKYFASNSIILPITLGSGLIFLGTLLGYEFWGAREGTYLELFRLLLVSGKYGIFVLLGCSWLIIPLGVYLRKQQYSDVAVNRTLPLIGLSLVFISLSCGRLVGWRSMEDLALLYGAPPQVWYIVLISGLVCLTISFLNRFNIPFVSKFLTYTGQAPLKVYVSHTLVLPTVSLLRFLFPQLGGAFIILGPVFIFIAYWGWVLLHVHKKNTRATTT